MWIFPSLERRVQYKNVVMTTPSLAYFWPNLLDSIRDSLRMFIAYLDRALNFWIKVKLGSQRKLNVAFGQLSFLRLLKAAICADSLEHNLV